MRHWFVVQRKGKRLSPAALAFKDFVLNQTGQFIRLQGSVIAEKM